MLLKSYPKINLYLKIVGEKQGYHLIESRFALIQNGFYDEIEIREFNRDFVEGDFGCHWKKSTIFNAISKMRFKAAFPPLKIEVKKNIPKSAGLGGGSSNAASVITGINKMFNLGLKKNDLMNIAKSIGADVPFFIQKNYFAEVRGIGEIIKKKHIDENDIMNFEIFTPTTFCDTKKVYLEYKKIRKNHKIQFSQKGLFEKLSNQSILQNNFTQLNDLFLPASTIYSELLQIKKELGNGWFFSGSGSSFFRPTKKHKETK